MKPVDQTLFGRPGGNCLAACIATILELPLDEVTVAGTDDTWLPNLSAWLAPRGLAERFKIPGSPMARGRLRADVLKRGVPILSEELIVAFDMRLVT